MVEDPLKREGAQPHTRLPSTEFLCWRGVSTASVSENQQGFYLPFPVGVEGGWKHRCPLLELTHGLAHWQMFTWPLVVGQWPEVCREELSCVAEGEGWRAGGAIVVPVWSLTHM